MAYQRKFDPSLFLMPPSRPNYPLPAFKGLLAQPQGQPITGMPPSLLSAPPPVDTMGGLMGEVAGPEDGFGNEVADNLSAQEYGQNEDARGIGGRMTNSRTAGLNGFESALASMATNAVGKAVPGFGQAMGAYNTVSNINNTMVNNQDLTAMGTPLSAMQQIGGALGFNSYNGTLADAMNGMMQSQRGRDAFSVGMPSTADINADIYSQQPDFQYDRPENFSIETQVLDGPQGDTDDFGGWGGYDSDYNDGPGADMESDPGDGGYDDSGDFGGDDDSGDEGSGDDDGWRHGGLLGDDGDGKFEAVKGTLHENEAVLKPEAVGLLGDDVVTQLNNVASLDDKQKKVLVKGLLDAIIGGKAPKKKTDFRASR